MDVFQATGRGCNSTVPVLPIYYFLERFLGLGRRFLASPLTARLKLWHRAARPRETADSSLSGRPGRSLPGRCSPKQPPRVRPPVPRPLTPAAPLALPGRGPSSRRPRWAPLPSPPLRPALRRLRQSPAHRGARIGGAGQPRRLSSFSSPALLPPGAALVARAGGRRGRAGQCHEPRVR